MEAYFYAQLDDNNICMCLSQLSGIADMPNMIRLTEEQFNTQILGYRYENGIFKENLVPEAANSGEA